MDERRSAAAARFPGCSRRQSPAEVVRERPQRAWGWSSWAGGIIHVTVGPAIRVLGACVDSERSTTATDSVDGTRFTELDRLERSVPSPCQGEGRGFESRLPLKRMDVARHSFRTRPRVPLSDVAEPDEKVASEPGRSGPEVRSCKWEGIRHHGGPHVCRQRGVGRDPKHHSLKPTPAPAVAVVEDL